jgi:hypothetical protein
MIDSYKIKMSFGSKKDKLTEYLRMNSVRGMIESITLSKKVLNYNYFLFIFDHIPLQLLLR